MGPKPELTRSAIVGILRALATTIERGETNYHEYERIVAPYVHYERRMIKLNDPRPADPKKSVIEAPILFFSQDSVKPLGVVRRVEGIHPKTRRMYEGPDVKYLRRFAKLPRPSRQLWMGKHTIYKQCFKIFVDFGFIVKQGRVNKWGDGYTIVDRLSFADQFDPKLKP